MAGTESVREDIVRRYGVEYSRWRFTGGVVCFLPTDEPRTPDRELLSSVVGGLQSTRTIDGRIFPNFGYRPSKMRRPGYPRSPRADVYLNEQRREFIKNPVEDKHGVLQSFAMNALSRSVDPRGRLQFARSSAAVRCRITGSSIAFSAQAPGVQLVDIFRNLKHTPEDNEKIKEFNSAVKVQVARLIKNEVPRTLIKFCNDNPAIHPLLGEGQGMQNVFISVPGFSNEDLMDVTAADAGDLTYTLIDQAHPRIYLGINHLLASRLPVGRDLRLAPGPAVA